MVTFLRQVHAPTGEFALMINFCSLSDMEMKTGEALESSTHQPPDFEDRIAAAVASALRNRVAATPAKNP